MINDHYNRRKFIKNTALAGMGLGLVTHPFSVLGGAKEVQKGKRVGIIGLDTSHAVAFTKELNQKKPVFGNGYRVVAAYPKGSLTIESSYSRIPGYIDKVKKMGVEIVKSIDDLLEKVDVVLLETNDGRRHLEQAIPVMKAGKTLFIDKPIAASLVDTMTIFKLSEHYKVPVFTSSSLRFMSTAQEVANGKIGKVLGADAYSPCAIQENHPDFYWYGIHGVSILYTVMGVGCKEVIRVHTENTDVAVGTWDDGRIGTFRGTRLGKHTYGGTAYGEKGDAVLGPYDGYNPLLKEIIKFFDSGVSPVSAEETTELYAFMSAADESRLIGGGRVSLEEVLKRGRHQAHEKMKELI